MKYLIKLVLLAGILTSVSSCKKYLDVVPDNVATIEYAFRNRSQAAKYLATIYNNIPNFTIIGANPAILGSDEFTCHYLSNFQNNMNTTMYGLQLGLQSVVSPLANYWDGTNSGKNYFQALRECNIFLENIDYALDLSTDEKVTWVAEVKFLKAYYHYWLLRMYGPIPLIKENLPISSSIDQVRIKREPVDDCVNYIVSLIDEAIPNLPSVLMRQYAEYGKITKSIAMSVKAEVLLTAASPLYNGNADYASFKNKDGKPLFNSSYLAEKWNKAADACKAAIDECHTAGAKLYYFQPATALFVLSDSTKYTMNVRAAITEKWNSELIWGASNVDRGLQANATACLSPPGFNTTVNASLAVPLKMTELFHSKNGVPIDEDLTYNFSGRFNTLRVVGQDHRYYLRLGYTTAQIHFDREPRYYADLAFDGSTWYGQTRLNDKDMAFVESKLGQTAGNGLSTRFSMSGIWPKKLVNYLNDYQSATNTYTVQAYPWPILRLSELYLYYAEALNESAGPSAEVYGYLDLVRKRAGLKGVVESWQNFSRYPTKPSTKDGLREIIRRERLIEIAFEGKRFWDIRRWKIATDIASQPITGWNIAESTTANYYKVRQLYAPYFTIRDYFWPISENSLTVNPNLVQNPGW